MNSENSGNLHIDEDMEPDPRLNELTNAIIGAAIEVHRTLGPGFLESVYEEALAIEFNLRGIPFARQAEVVVQYKGQCIGKHKIDFVVDHAVVLEIKAIEQLGALHAAQVISYLSATGHPLGLLLNFNARFLKDGIKRIAGTRRRS